MIFARVLLLSGLIGWTCTASHAITLSNIVEGVSEGSYSNHLANLYTHIGESRGFTDGGSPRTPLPQHDLARDYMVTNFTAWGYDTWLDPFEFDVNFSYDGDSNTYHYAGCNNVVATKWGSGGTNVYLLIAHYDSVDSGHRNVTLGPGADDGASGVAAQLTIAEAIKDYVFKDTIVIIACDAEEKDYQGSIYFRNNHITDNISETNATTFLKSTIRACVNIDSIAYDDTNNVPQVVMGTVSGWNEVAFAVSSAVSKYTGLTPRIKSGYNSSDHIAFNAIGIDSIHVIEYDFSDYWGEGFTPNPNYHSDYDAIDAPNYLKLDYAAEVTKGIAGALCEYATPIPPATLQETVGSNTVTVSWICAPNVDYSLYGASNLLSNDWTFIQNIPGTGMVTELSVDLDLASITQRMFKVIGE
jgi:hypothetical protein